MNDIEIQVRRADPDRFFCALLAPTQSRANLLLLAAFNHELARAREAVSEAGLGLVRLQWWREVIEGAAYAHPVATPLRAALDDGALDAALLLRMVAAREAEMADGFATLAEWEAWLRGSQGALAEAAGAALGTPTPALNGIGAAYGAAGVLRSLPWHAAQGRCLLPDDVLARHKLHATTVIREPKSPRLRPAIAELAGLAQSWLANSRAVPRPAIAAALPGVLARRDLARAHQPATPRGLGDRMAVLAAWRRGRV